MMNQKIIAIKKNYLLLSYCLVFITKSFSQDYFEDIQANGTPVLFKGNEKQALLSSRINIGDNSIKLTFFQQYKIKDSSSSGIGAGWGLFTKGKTEDNLGDLFGSGKITPGFSGGGYLALRKKIWKNTGGAGKKYSRWDLLLSGSLSTSQYQLFNSSLTFKEQLYDTIFNGTDLGLSWFYYTPFRNTDNLIIGASISAKRKNNYGQLDKVEIKNSSTAIDSSGTIRNITEIKDDGCIYATGYYKEYNSYNFRINVSYIPQLLDYKIAFIVYPFIDVTTRFEPKYNLGCGIHFLKDGSPSTSIAGILIEFNDVTSQGKDEKSFLKRSLSIGITGAINITTNKK